MRSLPPATPPPVQGGRVCQGDTDMERPRYQPGDRNGQQLPKAEVKGLSVAHPVPDHKALHSIGYSFLNAMSGDKITFS